MDSESSALRTSSPQNEGNIDQAPDPACGVNDFIEPSSVDQGEESTDKTSSSAWDAHESINPSDVEWDAHESINPSNADCDAHESINPSNVAWDAHESINSSNVDWDSALDDRYVSVEAAPQSSSIPCDMHFPKLHAFLRWLHAELLDSCIDFVQNHGLIEQAKQPGKEELSGDELRLKLTPWENIDEREITDWTWMICQLISSTDIFDKELPGDRMKLMELLQDAVWGAEHVRHAAAHHRGIDVEALLCAMKLPHVLNDNPRTDRIEKLFNALSDEDGHSFDEQTRKAAADTIFTDRPCKTNDQMLGRVESILQDVSFQFAQEHDPDLLAQLRYDVVERLELLKLEVWGYRGIYQDEFPNVNNHFENFRETIRSIRSLRNDHAHKNLVDHERFCSLIHDAIRYAIYVGNRVAAINIEVAAERWLTGNSEADVLKRMRDCFLAEELPLDIDERRRECRRRVAIVARLASAGFQLSEVESYTVSEYVAQYPQHDSSLVHVEVYEPDPKMDTDSTEGDNEDLSSPDEMPLLEGNEGEERKSDTSATTIQENQLGEVLHSEGFGSDSEEPISEGPISEGPISEVPTRAVSASEEPVPTASTSDDIISTHLPNTAAEPATRSPDLGDGSPEPERPTMPPAESLKRPLTSSPSMHECLKWRYGTRNDRYIVIVLEAE